MSEWKPIETAPKGRKIIDLHDGERRVVDCYYDETTRAWRKVKMKDATTWYVRDFTPKFWMERPCEPQAHNT